MHSYLALLRGINVGGKNKVPMAELRAACEAAGLQSVSTYIASGNLFFCSEEEDVQLLRARLEALVAKSFGVTNPIMVLPTAELMSAAAAMPHWWGEQKDAVHNAIFVLPPKTPALVLASVEADKSEEALEAKGTPERYAARGPVIFWTVERSHYHRSKLPQLIGSEHYQSITVRNVNTTRKLAALAQEAQEMQGAEGLQ
jgi:uncharacterized protein (DUF1697 family)